MINKKLLVNDIIITATAVILSLAAYIFMLVGPDKGTANTLIVYADGRQITTLHLDQNGEYPIDGHNFSVRIENGMALVSKTDCKDRVCTHMSADKNGGEIICLPNKIVIRHKQPATTTDLTDVYAG